MERILCNTEPTIAKIALLLNHRLTSIRRETRRGKSVMTANLDGKRMTIQEIKGLLKHETKKRQAIFVNHSNLRLDIGWL